MNSLKKIWPKVVRIEIWRGEGGPCQLEEERELYANTVLILILCLSIVGYGVNVAYHNAKRSFQHFRKLALDWCPEEGRSLIFSDYTERSGSSVGISFGSAIPYAVIG